MVELPDMERVSNWFDANKPEVKCRAEMSAIPETPDLKITLENDSDEKMWVLMMLFCMALRKGDV